MSPPPPDSPVSGQRLLVIVRHGAAEQYAEGDRRRRLTERGRAQARAAGGWLADRGVVPTHAFVSSATRTRETWAELSAANGTTAEPVFEDVVYSADTDGAIEVLRGAPDDASVVVLLGHNPTVASLAHLLDDGTPDPDAFRAMSAGFPPATVAVLEVPVAWCDLEPGTCHLTDFRAGGR